MNHPSRPKIGILALTLELYETLNPGLREKRETWLRQDQFPLLEKDLDLVFKHAMFSQEDIAMELSRFEEIGVDAIVIVFLTYAPSQLLVGSLKRTKLPILIWNTQEVFTVNEETFTPAVMGANHGIQGSQDLANVLLRSGVPFQYLTSHKNHPQTLLPLFDFCRAAMAKSRLHQMRVGLIGYPFPGMGDFAIDTTQMAATLGPIHKVLAVEEYIFRSRSFSENQVKAVTDEYRSLYLIADDITENDLEWTARAELAIRSMIRDYHLDALTYQFTAFGDDERTETLPFVPASRLMGEGIGFGGEGDIFAAATTTIFNMLMPPATFSEIFTVDFKENSLFMSHMGECNIQMQRKGTPVRLVARSKPITRTRQRQLCLIPTLEPGPATFMVLAQGPNSYRIITADVEIADFAPLPGFFVPHFKMIVKNNDICSFVTDYARLGGPHHNAVCFGDARSKLRYLAELLQAEYFEI